MNSVLRSFGARAVSFVPTAIGTLVASRLIIEHYGITAFNAYALIFSLINLVPLNDLGVGAAVTSTLAERGAAASRARRTLLTAVRVLSFSSLGTAVVAMLFGVLGLWQPILGEASGPNIWVGVALVIYAATFLPGLGQSILLGLHRNHSTILIQMFFNPLNAALAAVVVFTHSAANLLVLIPCVSLLAVNVVVAVVAGRVSGISWRRIIRRVPRRRRFPGARIRSIVGPVLVITLSTPLLLQSDRIVLSHVSSAAAVAEYSVALQIFGPALVLVGATAQPLWPIWARARAAGQRGPGIAKVVALFAVGGAAVGVVLAVLTGPIAQLVAGSAIVISTPLAVAGALNVVVAAVSHPVAMALMHPAGLRVVAWLTALALPLNVGLSIVLARHIGAPGPLLATAVVGLTVQTLPALIVGHRWQRAGRHLHAVDSELPSSDAITQGLPLDGAAIGVDYAAATGATTPYRPFRIENGTGSREPGSGPLASATSAHLSRPRPSPRARPDVDEVGIGAAVAAVTAPGALLQPIASFRRPRDLSDYSGPDDLSSAEAAPSPEPR